MQSGDLKKLETRLGRHHVSLRLGIEAGHESDVFRRQGKRVHIENWYLAPVIIRNALRLTGLYRRARQNAGRVELRHNTVRLRTLPAPFDGYTVLHMSDLHVDLNGPAMQRLVTLVTGLDYDLCVLTGDYRGRTHGPIDATMAVLSEIRTHLNGRIYAVLGNHDSLSMVPRMETMGIRVLLNESDSVERAGARLHLAGIDDAHYYRAHDIGKVAGAAANGGASILLSHTPEVYREAAQAGFDLLLAGHTHGGQICLPGGFPVILEAALPRHMGRGAWKFDQLKGYTSAGAGASIVAARLNCPPEITLHRLRRG